METSVQKAKWLRDSDGTWLSLLSPEATSIVEAMQPGKIYDVTIKEHKKKRSLDANAYFWVLADKLSAKLGIPKVEVYRSYIKDIGGNSEVHTMIEAAADRFCRIWEKNGLGWFADTMPSKYPGYVNVIVYYGSSTYDTAQMSRLIDLAVQDCKSVGIETMPPYKLEALLGRWECA